MLNLKLMLRIYASRTKEGKTQEIPTMAQSSKAKKNDKHKNSYMMAPKSLRPLRKYFFLHIRFFFKLIYCVINI